MTRRLERSAIEAFFRANWTATPLSKTGMDGHAFTPTENSILLTIKSGDVLQGSIGRVQNVIEHVGIVTATIYTKGGNGSDAWRGYAEALEALFFEASINTTGARAGTDVFVRFSPPQLSPNQHPYIGADFPSTPFHITNVIAPFVRYTLR